MCIMYFEKITANIFVRFYIESCQINFCDYNISLFSMLFLAWCRKQNDWTITADGHIYQKKNQLLHYGQHLLLNSRTEDKFLISKTYVFVFIYGFYFHFKRSLTHSIKLASTHSTIYNLVRDHNKSKYWNVVASHGYFSYEYC